MVISARALFCDDIRLEASGKHILIGVYSGFVRSPKPPASLLLSTWLEIRGLDVGSHLVSLTVMQEVDGVPNQIGHISNMVNVFYGDLPTVLTPGGLSVTVNSNCHLVLLLRVAEGEVMVVDRVPVFIPPPE